MTEHWFDRLSHDLAHGTSRRRSLQLVALLATGLLLRGTSHGEAAKKKGRKTKAKAKKAKGKTGKPKTQQPQQPQPPAPRPGHLGPPDGRDDCEAYLPAVLHGDCREIREQCQAPDQFCIHGIEDEVDPDDRGVACCPHPKTCCLFGCANTQTDRDNCGGCNVECDEGALCIDGECVCADPLGCCPRGQRRCDGHCIDPSAESTHCGECGNVCEGTRICVNGACQCPPIWPVECPAGCYEEGMQCCPNGLACEPDTYCFESNGGWGCCPNSWTC